MHIQGICECRLQPTTALHILAEYSHVYDKYSSDGGIALDVDKIELLNSE